MINGKTNEFVDNLYYGTEMYFTFSGKKYFIQGWFDAPLHFLVLDYEYETEKYDENNPECTKSIWEYSAEDAGECVQAFLKAPLWDGKTFYEAEKQMTWTD